MNKSIEEILKNIPDKFAHSTTTSHKFKKDIYNFFNKEEFKNKTCVEWGSNLGYTTHVLSYLFKDVTGFNKEKATEAIEFNKERPNVKFFTQDIYNTKIPISHGDVFLVDAEHTYHAVIEDTIRSLGFSSDGKKYFIYDDYGAYPEIKKAIEDLIEYNKIKIVCKIGYSENEKFTRFLSDYEGVICVEV